MIVCIICFVSYGIVFCKVCNYLNNNIGYFVFLLNILGNIWLVFVNERGIICLCKNILFNIISWEKLCLGKNIFVCVIGYFYIGFNLIIIWLVGFGGCLFY